MLEAVFSDSAAGSLQIAFGQAHYIGGATSVSILSKDGRRPSKEEIKKVQREAEERQKRSWAEAVPIQGNREDILCFPIALGTGAIDEAGIGPKREAALRLHMGVYPAEAEEAAGELLKTARLSLSSLFKRASKGEAIRLWSSSNPDEICGRYWLMDQLFAAGLENINVIVVELPDFEERPDGVIVQYTSWGDVEPHQWGRMAGLGKKLSPSRIRAMVNRWKQLKEENAPLRAIINGKLVSVPENFYDTFIFWELAGQKEEFNEALVIGNVLGKYQLGIGDAWVALRIEQCIRDGLLEPVSQPDPNGPIYHRILRKCRE